VSEVPSPEVRQLVNRVRAATSASLPAPPTPPGVRIPAPASIDFVYGEATAALASQRQDLNSLDTKAGVLIGASAAAFGLIATNGGSALSIFARHPALQTVSLVMLAAALLGLVGAVFVRSYIEYPDVARLIGLAELQEGEIKTLSLDVIHRAWAHNRALILKKSRWLLAGQFVLGLFVFVVVCFKVSEWDKLSAALAWLRNALRVGGT